MSTVARGDSGTIVAPMPKYISSPHVSAFASIGSASQIALAVFDASSRAFAETAPAVMRIVRDGAGVI